MTLPVFISWSGDRSRLVAQALRGWLPRVLQVVVPWVSEEDIAPGHDWLDPLNSALDRHRIGILCVTSENLTSPWMMFEAGALWRGDRSSSVIPYLLDVDSLSSSSNPLFQLSCVHADREGTWSLVLSLFERAHASDKVPLSRKEVIREAFEHHWPALEQRLSEARARGPAAPSPPRAATDLEEVILRLDRLTRLVSRLARRAEPGALLEAGSAFELGDVADGDGDLR